MVVPDQSKDLLVAYHGLIFIDDRKPFRPSHHAARRWHPAGFPIQDISLMLGYEYTRIVLANYLLPLNFELSSPESSIPIKNDVDYDEYRQFTADSSVKFSGADSPSEPKK